MQKSNKILLIMIIITASIIIMGITTTQAATTNQTTDNTYKTIEKQTPHKQATNNIQKDNNTSKNKKTSNELKEFQIYTENITCDYGDTVDIPVTSNPEDVSDGVLTWFIDGQVIGIHNLTYDDATISLNTSRYAPGTHDIYIDYGVSEEYLEAACSATLTINKAPTQLSITSTEYDSQNDIMITCMITSKDKTLTTGTINTYHDGTLIKTTNVNTNTTTFTINKEYNQELLEFEYLGNNYYDDYTSIELVNVDKLSLNVYLAYLSAFQSQTIHQTVQLNSNRIINDGKLDLYVDDLLIEEYDVNINEVNIQIDTNNYASGNYTIKAIYTGSKVYEDAEYTTTMNIKKIATTIYSNNITTHKNEAITLRASVYNYVDETNDGIIEFFLDNESIKTLRVENITVYEDYTIGESTDYGLHNITIKYHGTQKYEESTLNTTLDVRKYSNKVTLRNYTITDNGQIELNINTYSYQNTVDDGIIECIYNGNIIKTQNVTSNNTKILLPPEFMPGNDYNLTIRYYNSTKYEDDQHNTTISPEKIKTETRIYKYQNNNNILNITTYVYASTFDEINDGKITIYINNTQTATLNVTQKKAYAEINMTDYPEANYTIRADYTGNKVYAPSSNTTNYEYTIIKKVAYLNLTQLGKLSPADNLEINAKLVDYDGNLINITTPASIRINNNIITTQLLNGELKYTYQLESNTSLGQHTIQVTVPESKYYKQATRNATFNVQKNSTYIVSQNNIKTNKAEDILINATLNSNGQILEKNVTAILKINNKTIYQGKFNNGVFQYKLSLGEKYTSNTYNITIKSKETTKYTSSEKTITLNLEARKTYITSRNIYSSSGEKIIINATVRDSQTRKAVNGLATIKINNKTIANVTVKNGQIIYSYTNDYSAKTYNITIKYSENGVYNKSEWNGEIIISKVPIKISSNNINTKAYSMINITARILENNKAAAGTIKTAIKINNNTIDLVNVTDGLLNYQYQLPESLGSKTYNLTIIAGDSRRYTNASTNIILTVTKNYKQIKTENITASAGEVIRIQAQILDENNRPVEKTTPVNIKLGGRSIANLNTTNAIIDYEYTLPENIKNGTYDLLIQAGETQGYTHASTNTKIRIK